MSNNFIYICIKQIAMMQKGKIVDNGHWDYERLLCYKKAKIIYDLTFHFCSRFIDKRDRTHDQMIQAARSGKQNIVEGYVDSATSYEVALKLYNIARGSLRELYEDYKDYIATRGLRLWEGSSTEVMAMRKLGKEHDDVEFFLELDKKRDDEVIANMLLVLLRQEDLLLSNFIESEAKRFSVEGGFREKLTRIRLEKRNK